MLGDEYLERFTRSELDSSGRKSAPGALGSHDDASVDERLVLIVVVADGGESGNWSSMLSHSDFFAGLGSLEVGRQLVLQLSDPDGYPISSCGLSHVAIVAAMPEISVADKRVSGAMERYQGRKKYCNETGVQYDVARESGCQRPSSAGILRVARKAKTGCGI